MPKKAIYIVLAFLLTNSVYIVFQLGNVWRISFGISEVMPFFFLNGLFFLIVALKVKMPKIASIMIAVTAFTLFLLSFIFWLIHSIFSPDYAQLESDDGSMKIVAEYRDYSFLDVELTLDLYEKQGFFYHKLNDERINVSVVMQQVDDRPTTFFLGLENAHWTEDERIHFPIWRQPLTLKVNQSSSKQGGEYLYLQ